MKHPSEDEEPPTPCPGGHDPVHYYKDGLTKEWVCAACEQEIAE